MRFFDVDPSDAARFWSKVNRAGDNDCWEWIAGFSGPYGCARLNRIPMGSHRASWIIHHGWEPDEGLFVCHSCDNAKCVNPKHLWIGSASDNNKDKTKKGRQATGIRCGAYTHPETLARGLRHGRHTKPHRTARGENHGNGKLKQQDVLEIRRRYNEGELQARLAFDFDISQTNISRIILRKAWAHI